MRSIAYLGVLTAAAALLSYIETLIPLPFGIPGMKLGLTNLAIVLVLYLFGMKEALLVSVVRILIVGFLFGNLFSILFSLAGGLCSLLVMWLMKKSKLFGIAGVSVTGGVSHNLAQMAVASLVVGNSSIWYYFPILMTAGMLTGFLIGVLSMEMMKPLKFMKKE
ncbi:MAG: Gx transporter family protein [Lachnospiraceae bacterium]|nr:Gx transporter family protein [Lachnospiraceae bacterium]